MNLTTKVSAGIFTVATIITGMLPAIAIPGNLTTGSNLRTRASENAQILTTLPKGTQVEVLNITPNNSYYWYYIELKKGRNLVNGWVRGDLISVNLGDNIYASITAKTDEPVNVRSQPNLNSRVLRTAFVGDVIKVEGSNQGIGKNRWYRVTFPNGVRGWVRADLLSIWPKRCVITCTGF